MRVSWSLGHGKALVTTVRNDLFSHFNMSQQCFRLATWVSRELKACVCRAWKSKIATRVPTDIFFFTNLQRNKHQMYPYPRVPRPHREIRFRVQTMLPPTLTSEMQLGRFLLSLLLDGALGRRRNPDRHLIHVSFDFIQVLLAEVLYGVPHRVRLEHAHPLIGQRILIGIQQSHAGVVHAPGNHRNRIGDVHVS
jgi:hypothetical protein